MIWFHVFSVDTAAGLWELETNTQYEVRLERPYERAEWRWVILKPDADADEEVVVSQCPHMYADVGETLLGVEQEIQRIESGKPHIREEETQ